MKKQLLLTTYSWLILLCGMMAGCSKPKAILISGNYFAITPDGLQRLALKGDTLLFNACTDTTHCEADAKYAYKILDTKRLGNAQVLYVQTIRYLSAEWKASGSYQVLTLAYSPDSTYVGIVRETNFYNSLADSKKAAYNPQYKFTTSYYTPAFLKTIAAYPAITTIDSSGFWKLKKRLVREAIRNKELIRNTHTGDVYMTGTTRELVNRALIDQKINPLMSQTELTTSFKKLKAHIPL